MKRQTHSTRSAAVLYISIVGAAAALAVAQGSQQPPPPPRRVGSEFGFAIFQERCMTCHGNPDASIKAPAPATLRQMTPEAILSALTTGVMKLQGQSLTDEERRQVAESLAGRPLGTATEGDAATMPNRCASNPPLANPAAAPAWNGWGVDIGNSRFQPAGPRPHGRRRPRLDVEMGVRLSERCLGVQPTDGGIGTRIRGRRHGIRLLARRRQRLRLLVVPDEGGVRSAEQTQAPGAV
jgi:cytochrome c553